MDGIAQDMSIDAVAALFTASPDGVVITHSSASSGSVQIVSVNPALLRLLQLSAAGALEGGVEGLLASDTPEVERAVLMTALQRGQPLKQRMPLAQRAPGSRLWAEAAVTPLPFYGAMAQCFCMLTLRDISPSLEAARRLEGERDLLRTLIETVPEAISAKDRQGRYLYANGAALRLLGAADRAQVLGRRDRDLLPALTAERHAADEDAVMATGMPLVSQEECVHDSRWAEPMWTSVTRMPLHDTSPGAAGAVGGVVAVSRDITARRMAEARLNRQTSLLTVVAGALPVMILFVDMVGTVHFANRTAAMWLQRDGDTLVGQGWPEVVARPLLPLLQERMPATFMGETGFADAVAMFPDGAERFLRIELRPAAELGRMIGAHIIAFDVTEQERARQHALLASRAKSEFLASMSHELRTPLNAILGFAEIIGMEAYGPIGDRHYAEYARDIYSSGKLLLDLISDVLDLAKIEAGRMSISPEPVDMAAVAASAVKLIGPRARKSRVEMIVDVPADLPAVFADERAAMQILLNLLSNAVKFSPEGGEVRLSAQVELGRLLVSVADRGIGMSAEDLARIGRPFVQVDSSLTRRHEGSGIGLYITKALVELHRGSIDFASLPGEGTTVTFSLPLLAG